MLRSSIQPSYILSLDHRGSFAGVEPYVWKLEGLEQRGDCERRITREAAVTEIARQYRQWVDTFKRARAAAGSPEGAFATAHATLPQG